MSDYDRIRVLICDHLNLARGKYIPSDHADRPVRMCMGVYALGYDREEIIMAPSTGASDGLPDIVAKFNKSEIRDSWEDNTGVVVAQVMYKDKPHTLCARTALKRAIDGWRTLKLTPKIGIELEAFLLQRSADGRWIPCNTSGAYLYGTGDSANASGIIDQIWRQSEKYGFNLAAVHSEYSDSQFEFTMACDEALKAVDEVFLFRLMASEICLQAGYRLSFMPKPLTDKSGNGFHINFSLSNGRGENMFFDRQQDDRMSALAKSSIAGLLYHHKGLAGLVAPTVNSYRRLRPAQLSGYWANWGYDHRGAMARIPGERGRNTRIEYRLADCAANPYIAVAATLQSALLGHKKDYALPPPETGNCLDTVDTDQCVADTLGQALVDLEQDKILSRSLGKDLVRHFLSIKNREWQRFLDATTDWELNEYIHFL